MKKTLSINGNSWQLYINKPIADLIGISKNENFVNLKVEKNILYISKGCENEEKLISSKKLIKRGSGFGLNFPIPILELLEINPEKDLIDVSIENGNLVIKKSQ